MATGKVKWFNAQKRFAFIQPEDGGKDAFLHIAAVQTADLKGFDHRQEVTDVVTAEHGKQATANLRLT